MTKFLKNTGTRLITIRVNNESYPLLCGDNPAVELPESAYKTKFVKSLVESGELVEVSKAKSEEIKKDIEQGETVEVEKTEAETPEPETKKTTVTRKTAVKK